MVRVVELGITKTTQDWAVLEGVRTVATQRIYVARGASQTMDSRHLTGHAVDLAAWIGMIRWEWALYPPIADAMRRAAIELNIPIRWGGGWFILNDYSSEAAVKRATDAYVAERRAQKRKAFLDGGHFELPLARYP